MSAFRHPHNHTVRPLEEELAEMGLNPDKVLSEIERNTAALEGGPSPLDLGGLKEGDKTIRSLVEYGDSLKAEGCDKPNGKKSKKAKTKKDDDADTEVDGGSDGDDGYEGMESTPDPDQDRIAEQKTLLMARLNEGDGEDITEEDAADLLYLIDEGWELDEVFGVVKKIRGAAARIAKRVRHRAYLKVRGAKKLAAKIYRKKFKRKIKRGMTKKLRRFGRKGLEKLHKMGKRIVQKSWADQIANIQEELDAEAVTKDADIIEEEVIEYAPIVEAMYNAAETAMYLGEIFDAMGDDAGQVLLTLSDKAVDLGEAIEANEGDPTEDQEAKVETVLNAVIKALAEHEERGAPSLSEAIGITMVAEGLGTWDDLVEANWTPPHVRTMTLKGRGASVDPSVAGKYLKALNMAMQKREPEKAMKAAEVVVKKHKVMDAKGLPVTSVSNMTDVMRVMFYLSQATGLKAPSWMYQGKEKPWFVMPKSKDDETPKADKGMATALKALGAPAGLLKALAAA